MELAASCLAVIELSSRILLQTAVFVNEAKHASEVKGDLFAKVSDLHWTLEAVNGSLRKREQQMTAKTFSVDEAKILIGIREVLERCEQTVERFSTKIESFGREREIGWVQKAMLQLKLEIKSPTILNFEKSVDANIASLQVLMSCFEPFMHEETQTHLHTGEIKTNKYLGDIYHEIRRVSELLAQGNPRSPTAETAPLRNETEGNVTFQAPVDLEDARSDIKMMRDTVDVAESFINTLSNFGSVVGGGGCGWSIPDDRQTATNGTGYIMEGDESESGGVEVARTGLEVPARKGSNLSPEIMVALFDGYRKEAHVHIRSKYYEGAEFNLRKAIELGEQREARHALPFEERFEFRKLLAEVYTKQNKFDTAKRELLDLEAHAQHDPKNLAEWFCSFADLHRTQYHDIRDKRLLKGWEDMAKRAYADAWDRELSDVLTQSGTMLIELYELTGDTVAAQTFRSFYQKSAEIPGETRPEQPVLPRNPTLEQRLLQIRPLPSPPTTPRSSLSDASGPRSLLGVLEKGNVEVAKLFIERDKNIDLEQTNDTGLTPLLLAAKKKETLIVRLLLGRSDIHARDNNGKTVLHHALFSMGIKDDMVQSLADYHADVNAVDKDGKRPLHYCVDFNKPSAAQILIDKGADIEAKNPAGETAAMQAVKRSNMDELIKVLYHAGAFSDIQRPGDLSKHYANLLDQLAASKQSPAGRRARRTSIASSRSLGSGIIRIFSSRN